MIKEMHYMIWRPEIFRHSVVKRPRTMSLLISAPFWLLIGVAVSFLLPYPWSVLLDLAIIIMTAATYLLYRTHEEELHIAWRYLRGRGEGIWIFNKG